MLGNPWSPARAYGRLAAPMILALTLAACASGDSGQDTANPFTTSPPHSDTGTPITDGGGTGTPTTSATDGGGNSNSNSDTGSATVPDPTSDVTTDPVDPTENPDADCIDVDGDGFGVDCQLGEDCDDNDYNNHTPAGCMNCVDNDGDDVWVGCDQYGADKPGPDCDDDNDQVGSMDAEELCNGIAENCAGEIDPLPADQMCPTTGDAPNVAGVGGWACNPVTPGEDGCEIVGCLPGFYDANKTPADGCECVGTDRTKSLDSCGDGAQGLLGVIAEGGVVPPLQGAIGFSDNGPGNGMEDWFVVQFPEAMAQGVRPNAGNIVVTFAVNPGDAANPDYRLEVYRDCNGKAFDLGLATQYGPGAPPAREWSFNDNHPDPGNPNYKNDIPWPEKVYVRVIRVNNSGSCSQYTLQVSRTPN